MTCAYEGCDKQAKSKGLCNGHNEQRRTGKELCPLRERQAGSSCSFEGCGRATRTKGLCHAHYKQVSAGKQLASLRPRRKNDETAKTCSFDECSREAMCKGLCASHYAQRAQRGSLTPIRSPGPSTIIHEEGRCFLVLLSLDGTEKARATFDVSHAEVVRAYRWYAAKNYVQADTPNGKIRLHRLITGVAEGLEVDHIDGNPLNNQDNNLRIATHAQNGQNLKLSKASSTGVRNVQSVNCGTYKGLFRVVLMKDGKQHHGGFFKTVEEASVKAEDMRSKLFTHAQKRGNKK